MKYKMVGYGSLISHESLKETISDKKFIPVIIKGYKRMFNLAVNKGNHSDVLNVTKSRGDNFNGVLFGVDDDELKRLKERENDYNLDESWAYDFATHKKICKCFFCTDFIVSIDKIKRKPEKSYFKLCREAAYNISKEFGLYWDNTTYTSDNEKISSWIKENPEYNTIKEDKM